MKEQWKRNAVVATVLLFVCAAVYLNWRYAGDVGADAAPAGTQSLSATQENKDAAPEKDGGVTTKVLGDAALVGGEVVPSEGLTGVSGEVSAGNYFDTARLSRQQSRDNALALLREASTQESADQAALDEANRAIQTLAGYTMLESQIENLVVAKGYADCVAFMGENGVSIVVAAAEDGLQTEDAAKIMDIVLSETDYKADQIKIMEAD